MKKITIVIFIIFSANISYACLSAYQNRIFPIGYCSRGLVTVEVHLARTEKVDGNGLMEFEFEPIWYGRSYLNIYDKKYKLISSEFLDSITIFPDTLYNEIINKTFLKGFSLANKIPDLTIAKPVSISFCDYQKECKTASLQLDTVRSKAYIKLKSSKKHEITILKDSTSIASGYSRYCDGMYYEGADNKFKCLTEELFLNSIRYYQIGSIKLSVIYLGSGQISELIDGGTYPPGKEYDAPFKFDKIEASTFEEPVLHHGRGFDFFIIE